DLVIVTQWEQAPSQWLMESYQQELGQLMSDLEIRYRFKTLEETSGRAFGGPILVLRMVERHRRIAGQSPVIPGKALAWTHINDTEVTPFGVVDLSALQRFLCYQA